MASYTIMTVLKSIIVGLVTLVITIVAPNALDDDDDGRCAPPLSPLEMFASLVTIPASAAAAPAASASIMILYLPHAFMIPAAGGIISMRRMRRSV